MAFAVAIKRNWIGSTFKYASELCYYYYYIGIHIHTHTHTAHVGTRTGSIVSVLVYSLKSFLLDHFLLVCWLPLIHRGQQWKHNKAEELSSTCCWWDKASDWNNDRFYLITLTANCLLLVHAVKAFYNRQKKLIYCIKAKHRTMARIEHRERERERAPSTADTPHSG